MKHISKFDGYEYEISYSVADEDGTPKYDDITLIWRDAPCGVGQAFKKDIPPRELVGWYLGEYDFKIVEDYIKKYWENKVASSKQLKSKPSKTMDLPAAYVNFIGDCLDVVKNHNLYKLLCEDDPETAKGHLDEVLTEFCEPLFEYDDTVIILEEEE